MPADRAVGALALLIGPSELVFTDQRLGVDADRAREGANVPSDVQVTPARLVVILLDAADDRATDPGAFAELIDCQARLGTGLGQRLANSHKALHVPACVNHLVTE